MWSLLQGFFYVSTPRESSTLPTILYRGWFIGKPHSGYDNIVIIRQSVNREIRS